MAAHKSGQATEVSTSADAVELSTFHGAKGLEWPVVHVAGLEKGYVPIGYAKTGAQLAEERRLLYVAITRAQQLCVLAVPDGLCDQVVGILSGRNVPFDLVT